MTYDELLRAALAIRDGAPLPHGVRIVVVLTDENASMAAVVSSAPEWLTRTMLRCAYENWRMPKPHSV